MFSSKMIKFWFKNNEEYDYQKVCSFAIRESLR